MEFKPDFLGYNFIWFMGEVEERNDPLKLGRVKVRCFGWHPKSKEELPTVDLPWAQTIQPVTLPAAPSSGLTVGIWVFGFFLDGEKAQRPIILGQVPGYRYNENGESESELPRAARVEENYPSSQSELRSKTRVTDILLSVSNETSWDEPEEPQDKQYPFVQTIASEAGYITETILGPKDTQTGRFVTRQVSYDCAGGYEERKSPSGDKIIKIIGDCYEIICGNNNICIKGDVNLTVDGNMRTNVGGDYELNVAGNMYTTVGKDQKNYVGGDYVSGITGIRDLYIGKGDTRIVASGGLVDRIEGNVTYNVTGNEIRNIQGALTETASTHNITLGSGTLLTTGLIQGTTITATGTVSGNIVRQGTIILGTHKHIGVTPGGSISGIPTP